MRRLIMLVCLFLAWGSSLAMAADAETRIGVVKNVKGTVAIERDRQSIPAKAGDKLFEKDRVITGAKSSVGLILRDNSVMSLGPNTRVVMSEYMFVPAERKLSMVARISRGTMTYLTGVMGKMKPEAVRIETPTAVCGVRGTHLAIKVEDGDE